MPFPKVIYEDDEVLVLDKPAGLLVHPASKQSSAPGKQVTLTDWLLEHYPDIKRVGEPLQGFRGELIPRPGIVHRLDKDTSGIILVAKTQSAFLFLKRQFQSRAIKKSYRVLVCGRLLKRRGVIDEPIGRARRDRKLRAGGQSAAGKLREATTTFEVLERFKYFTYLEAAPQTGRTHQLRVHFKSIGHPVACDPLYAPHQPCPPPLRRQALHAAGLELTLPSGTRARFEAELSVDFAQALANLRTA